MTRRQRSSKTIPLIALVALGLWLSACSAAPESAPPKSPDSMSLSTPQPSTGTNEPGEQTRETEDTIVGAVVHFTTGDVRLEVVIGKDNPTTRSFLAMLPMTVEFSDFAGKEKVAAPTGEWDFTDAEGMNPEVGDLFSYIPWGNLGFFYSTEGNTFSNDLTRIGRTDDIDQIELLDGEEVTIAIAD